MSNKTRLSISVEETTRTRHYWASRPAISESTIEKILSSEILIVPWENRSGAGDTFPAGTTEFVRRISKGLETYSLTIAVEPSAYRELSLHADHVRWPTIAVTTVAFGIVASVLGNEITALLNQPEVPQTIEMELIVERSSEECVSIKYLGPPSRALDTLIAESKACFPQNAELDQLKPTAPASKGNSEDSMSQ